MYLSKTPNKYKNKSLCYNIVDTFSIVNQHDPVEDWWIVLSNLSKAQFTTCQYWRWGWVFFERTRILSVMKSQVGWTTLRLVRDNKSIKTIMVPRPSYQTRLNQEHKQDQSKRRIIQWQSFISTIVYSRLVLMNWRPQAHSAPTD